MQVGIGYDVHKLVAGRKLILGGVEVPYAKGLLGHSDADVLTHVVMDALLGAAAAGSIGKHFPDTDPQYKDISSLNLLEKVKEIIAKKGFSIGNVDSVIVAQEPKLEPHLSAMVAKIAAVLEIDENKMNVKVKSTEGLGFLGKKEGIAAYAVATVE